MIERTLTLAVDPAHPAFAGHFPGTPIVPGVLLLDWAQQAISEAEGARGRVGELSVVKFHSPVRPGETLLLHYAIKKNESEAGAKITFRIECEARPIASGTLNWTDSAR